MGSLYWKSEPSGHAAPLLQVSTIKPANGGREKREEIEERRQRRLYRGGRMGLTGCQALEEWCRLLLNSYSGVNINNMTSSWADGKAFCALIHSHRPDLINWEAVKRNNSYQNCQLAFLTAETGLGITALLDVSDVARGCPDRLSILTYVSQFYHTFQSDSPDSGISSPSEEQDRTRRGGVRGGVHSLINIRRSRSVSASPPIQKENPFRREFLGNHQNHNNSSKVSPNQERIMLFPRSPLLDYSFFDDLQEHVSSKAETSPCKKLVNKFHKQKSVEQQPVRLRHQNTAGEKKTRRLVRSMFVEPLQDTEKHPEQEKNIKPIEKFQNGRKSLIIGPRPYRNIVGSADTESQSILSKTQNYLQEKRKRSQSQPPVDKKEKRKFDFLSTSNFNKIPVSKNNLNTVIPSNKDTLDSQKKTANPKENIQRRPKQRNSKETEKSSLITPNFCNFQKFEFTLKNHRQFVQTLV